MLKKGKEGECEKAQTRKRPRSFAKDGAQGCNKGQVCNKKRVHGKRASTYEIEHEE